jgi:transcriptional regulator with XRE-family HTH domain
MLKTIEPVDKLVGQNIRIFRTAKGVSQTELGALVGVTFQQIQKYEKGVNRVGSSRLAKIAQILQVPVGQFFDGAISGCDSTLSGTVMTELLTAPYAVQLLKAFAKVPSDKLRRSLVTLAESLAEHSKI